MCVEFLMVAHVSIFLIVQ